MASAALGYSHAVALSEVGPDSAPLQFVRGSRWGVKYQDKATHRQDRATQQRKYACTHARVPLCQHGELVLQVHLRCVGEIEALREVRTANEPWEVVSSILPKGGRSTLCTIMYAKVDDSIGSVNDDSRLVT